MKKLITAIVTMGVGLAMGIFAYAGDDLIKTTQDNVNSGINSVNSRPQDMMDSIHTEASKGKGVGEQVMGIGVGGMVGTRNAIHKLGAGAIDVLTFWIPKKEPLIKEAGQK
ncbi:MAG: hypothetical protein HYZ52_02715 [Candidatus Omnitrophica bacterium]|nr:hypothetical protein [Candidatus Omnitrophota bacterium]